MILVILRLLIVAYLLGVAFFIIRNIARDASEAEHKNVSPFMFPLLLLTKKGRKQLNQKKGKK